MGGDGTTWQKAWKSFSTINWAIITSGDTVFISGGTESQVYYEILTINKAGNALSKIVIAAATDSGHNGKVIIDGQHIRDNGILANAKSNCLITGKVNGNANLLIRNCTNSSNNQAGTAISAHSCKGWVIEYVEIDSCNNGVYIPYAENTEIRYSFFHNIQGDHAIFLCGYTGNQYDINTVHHCKIQLNTSADEMIGGGPDGVQTSDGTTVHDCEIWCTPGPIIGLQHPDAVQALSNYVKVYNNRMSNLFNSCFEGGSHGTSWTDIQIFNNILNITSSKFNRYQRGIEFTPNSAITDIKNIFILNNTFVDLTFLAIHFDFMATNPLFTNVKVQNNVFFNCGKNASGLIAILGGTHATIDNIRIDSNLINPGTVGYVDISIQKTKVRQYYQIAGVPSFVKYVAFTENNDFHLKSNDTAASKKGQNFLNLFSFDKDYTNRPAQTNWDIGA
jgi:hypothetical protein